MQDALAGWRALKSVGRSGEAERELQEALRRLPPREAHYLTIEAGFDSRPMSPRVGEAWFPVAFKPPRTDAPGGLIRVLARVVDRPPGDVEERLGAALEQARRAAQQPDASIELTFDPPLNGDSGLVVDGDSLQLAVAVAAHSALVKIALPCRCAVTGAFDPDVGLRSPTAESLRTKLATVRQQWPDAEGRVQLYAGGQANPGGDSPEGVTHVETLDALLGLLQLPPAPPRAPSKPEEAARFIEAHRDHPAYWPSVRASAEALLAASERRMDPSDLMKAMTYALRAANHQGDHAQAAIFQAALDRLAPTAARRDANAARRTAADTAMRLIDRGEPGEAVRLLKSILAKVPAQELETQPHADQLLTEMHGTLARAYSALGDHAHAIDAGRRALPFAPDGERPRSLGDLALWHLRAGQLEMAHQLLLDAEVSAGSLEDEAELDPTRSQTAAYRALFTARLEWARGDREATLHHLDRLRPVWAESIALALGWIELALQVGAPHAESDLAALDNRYGTRFQSPGIAARYRAPIEARRAAPDYAAMAKWAPGECPDDLAQNVPY